MTAKLSNADKILGNAFREAREILGLSVAAYSQLFEVDSRVVEQLENNELPDQCDDKLLKLVLATIEVRHRVDFLDRLLQVVAERDEFNDIYDYPYPLIRFFELIMGPYLGHYPWVLDGAVFRCRLLQLTDQANGILLWAESADVHRQFLAKLPHLANAHVDLLGGFTIIFVPAIYLFLKLDTTSPHNPLPGVLSERFKEKLPVGIAVPREPFTVKSPSEEQVAAIERRLFIYSPDPGSICEILAR